MDEEIVWKSIGNLQAVSLNGFAVRVFRFYLEYAEGPRTMEVGLEIAPDFCEVAFDPEPRWLPPFQAEEFRPVQLARIKSRVRRSLDALGMKPVFLE